MITLLPSEVEIIRLAISKLEIESIVPPAKPSDTPVVIAKKKAQLTALHSLCKKLLL